MGLCAAVVRVSLANLFLGSGVGRLGAAPERLIGRSISGLLAPDQAETAAQIARELSLSRVTVRSHVSSLVKKLGVEDRDAAVRLFAEGAAEG